MDIPDGAIPGRSPGSAFGLLIPGAQAFQPFGDGVTSFRQGPRQEEDRVDAAHLGIHRDGLRPRSGQIEERNPEQALGWITQQYEQLVGNCGASQ